MKKSLIFGIFLILFSGPVFGTVDISANPQQGPSPLQVSIVWVSSGVQTCSKDGIVVPTSGTEQKTVNVDTTYSISCTGGKNYTDVSWMAPTQLTDGSPIPATGPNSLAGYKIYYSTNPTTVETSTPITINNKNTLTYRINGQPNATYYYKMTAFTTANVQSAFTGQGTNIINLVQSSDSVLVNILSFTTNATTVYNMVKRENGFVLVAVGTVPLNTPCDITQSVNGHYVVPVSFVSWLGSVRSVVVVGSCSQQ